MKHILEVWEVYSFYLENTQCERFSSKICCRRHPCNCPLIKYSQSFCTPPPRTSLHEILGTSEAYVLSHMAHIIIYTLCVFIAYLLELMHNEPSNHSGITSCFKHTHTLAHKVIFSLSCFSVRTFLIPQ